MRIIDTHAHLYDEAFAGDIAEVVARAQEHQVEKIFLPNINEETLPGMQELCDRWSGLFYPMLGLHPTDLDARYDEVLDWMERMLESDHPFIGVGEVGLDYYWDRTYYKEQQTAFLRQVEWAAKYDLPLMIHSRSARQELVGLLQGYKGRGISGVFHSFGGTWDEARELLSFDGFMIGINGVVTFKNSGLRDVLPQIPLDRVVLETDAPYLTPVPYRGKRNESAYICHTLEKVAELYGLPVDVVAEQTRKNALNIFQKVQESGLGS